MDNNFDLWIRLLKNSISVENSNTSISEIINRYMDTIKQLDSFDIRLTADVILVAGILLRMKSENLYNSCEFTINHTNSEDEEEYFEDDRIDDFNDAYDEDYILSEEINIDYSEKQPEKQNISMNNLITMIKSELNTIKTKSKKSKSENGMNKKSNRENLDTILNDMIEQDDISDLMEKFMMEISIACNIIYQKKYQNREEQMKYFLPMLYLANEQKIALHQDIPLESELKITKL